MSSNEAFALKVVEVLDVVVKSIVDHPDEISVQHQEGGPMIIFSIKCNRQDKGKIIGKEGRMAISLRNIVNSLSAKYKIKGLLEVER